MKCQVMEKSVRRKIYLTPPTTFMNSQLNEINNRNSSVSLNPDKLRINAPRTTGQWALREFGLIQRMAPLTLLRGTCSTK